MKKFFPMLLILGATSLWAEPVLPVQTVEPTLLLGNLPNAQLDWELKRSFARNDMGVWLRSYASREFEIPLPATPMEENSPPALVTVTLTDTGFHRTLLGPFHQFETGKTEFGEGILIESKPAYRQIDANGNNRLRILVKDRYVYQITYPDSIATTESRLLSVLALKSLDSLPLDGKTEIDYPVVLTRVDELNPARNRKTPLYWVDAVKNAEALANEEAEQGTDINQ